MTDRPAAGAYRHERFTGEQIPHAVGELRHVDALSLGELLVPRFVLVRLERRR
jgi:hypothetical protein